MAVINMDAQWADCALTRQEREGGGARGAAGRAWSSMAPVNHRPERGVIELQALLLPCLGEGWGRWSPVQSRGCREGLPGVSGERGGAEAEPLGSWGSTDRQGRGEGGRLADVRASWCPTVRPVLQASQQEGLRVKTFLMGGTALGQAAEGQGSRRGWHGLPHQKHPETSAAPRRPLSMLTATERVGHCHILFL